MKREIPLLIAFLGGLTMILAYFMPLPILKLWEVRLSNWQSVVLGFSIFLGLSSLLRIHGEKISRNEPEYPYSVVLLASLFITTCAGIFYGVGDYYPAYVAVEAADAGKLVAIADKWDATKTMDPAKVMEAREEILIKDGPEVARIIGTYRSVSLAHNLSEIAMVIKDNREAKKEPLAPRESGELKGKIVVKVGYYNIFQWIFLWLYNPLQSTMFALLAFYMASAAFRAFRARTLEGTLLLISAFLVMIGRTSVGYWLNTKFWFLPFTAIQEWIMEVPTTAGQRTVMIGAALGVVSASLRMLLGLEQTYLGGD